MIDQSHPSLPVAAKIVIPPTNNSAPTTAPAIATNNGPSSSSSLDPQETSVRDTTVVDFLNAPAHTFTPLTGDWKTDLLTSVGPPTPDETFLHSGWKVIRDRVAASMFRTVQPDSRIRSFLTCGRGSWVERAKSDWSRFRLRVPYCHDRMCMVCGNHRSHKIRDALLNQIQGKDVSFITLTLCGKGEPLKELIERLYKHFRALRLHPLWAENVKGGAAILEIKHSAKAKRWHPHLHIIADAKFIQQSELSAAWRSISKDSFIVDIRRVKNPAVAGSYVCKYASKPLDTSFTGQAALLDEAITALKGTRLCICFGDWYGTPLQNAEDEELADDLVDADGYSYFIGLADLMEQANRGDRDSIEIIKCIPGAEARWRASLTPG